MKRGRKEKDSPIQIPEPILVKGQTATLMDPKNRPETNVFDEKMLYAAIDLIKGGLLRRQVTEVITNRFHEEGGRKNVHPVHVETLLTRAYDVIQTEYDKDIVSVMWIHIQRYQKQFKELREWNYDDCEDQEILYQKKRYNGEEMLQLLFAKEKVIGLHRKGVVLKLNQKNTTVIRNKTKIIGDYDISKLSFEEKLRLLSLIEKSKRTEDELTGVILSDRYETSNIEEAVYEDLTQPANVESIVQVQSKPEDESRTTDLNDIFAKLQKTFEEKAKKEFKIN